MPPIHNAMLININVSHAVYSPAQENNYPFPWCNSFLYGCPLIPLLLACQSSAVAWSLMTAVVSSALVLRDKAFSASAASAGSSTGFCSEATYTLQVSKSVTKPILAKRGARFCQTQQESSCERGWRRLRVLRKEKKTTHRLRYEDTTAMTNEKAKINTASRFLKPRSEIL